MLFVKLLLTIKKEKTLIDVLNEIYEEFGYYREKANFSCA